MKIVKSSIALLLVLLLVTTFACGGSGPQSNPTPLPGWSTYSNSSLGISMQYRQDWTKVEGQFDVVEFFSPLTGESSPQGVLMIYVHDALNMTLSERVDEWISYREKSVQDFNLSESNVTTIAGIPAHKVVYTWEDEDYGFLMKNMEIHAIKDSTEYIIIYMVYESAYANYLDTAQQMIDSFVIY
ncbi:MAG: hypothetical protein WC562_05525 [Dehalococcoidia bacterium]